MKYKFLALVIKEDDGFFVEFPDLNHTIKIFLSDMQLLFLYLLPHMRMDFPATSGYLRSQHSPIRQNLTKIIVVSILIQFPAIPLAKALQFFPAWHIMSLRRISSDVVRSLITYGKWARRLGAADQ